MARKSETDEMSAGTGVAVSTNRLEGLKSLLSWIIGASAVYVIGIVLVYVATFGMVPSKSQEVWAQFWDYFGGVAGPLLSFLGLMGLILTIVLQYRQLEMSRTALENSSLELGLTREELHRAAQSSAAMAASNQEMVRIAQREARLSLIARAHDVAAHKEAHYSGNPRMEQQWRTERERLGDLLLAQVQRLDLDAGSGASEERA